jgi:glycosyltransferase involved in cell wall biosynthesis
MPNKTTMETSPLTRAVSICTYNRSNHIGEVIEGVLSTVPNGTDVFVCDDGSTDGTGSEVDEFTASGVTYFRGPNKGVGANKTRALYLMKNHHYSCILEDDLVPTEPLWFETYEGAATLMDIHHFCRIQDKEIPETMPSFSAYMKETLNCTPIYASSPRGDLTFITRKVISAVGGMNPAFQGVGYAHGEWSNRVVRAGLISHPLHWVDIAEARDKFKQVGDTEGGRWEDDPDEIAKQLERNKNIARHITKADELYCPLRIV